MQDSTVILLLIFQGIFCFTVGAYYGFKEGLKHREGQEG